MCSQEKIILKLKIQNLQLRKVSLFVTAFIFYIALLSTSSCNKKEEIKTPLFSLTDSTGINFQNTVIDSKTDNSFLFRNFYNGGGVATGDINNDGLPDVMMTSNMGDNKLYLNKGNFRFEDISVQAGLMQDSMWSTGVSFVDINSDGWLDIYVCNSGHMNDGNRLNKLYINNHGTPSGNGSVSFTESAKEYGLDHSGYCTQASFLDYDMDGDLDCFLINNSPLPFSSLQYGNMRDMDIDKWKVDDNLKGGGNHLYRNEKNHFTEVTKQAGLHSGLISFGLGVVVGDINNDGYPDMYVGNDFIERDYLYINQKDGTFKDLLEDQVQKISMSSMSVDLADINNDGYPEIFTTDMIPDNDYRLKTTGTFDNFDLYNSKQKSGLYHQYVKNCLQLNNQNGTFSEIGNYAGVSGTDWSWGALFFDADNDGLNDIFTCNGINRDLGDLDFLDFFSNDAFKQMQETGKRRELDELLKKIPVTPLSNRVFKNNGNLGFTDIGSVWGLGKPGFSNSVSYADLDGDGDLDLVVNNENQPAFVYRNNSRELNGNSYISIVLKGTEKNRFAIGSKIKVYKDNQVFYRELFPSRGFQSSVDYKVVIGLGKLQEVDSMIVVWPDRSFTKYDHPTLNQLHTLQQPVVKTNSYEVLQPSVSPLLLQIPVLLDKHEEDDYIDFYTERNLPEMLSREGPKIGKADVNGDGFEDLYIGGAKGQAGQLYLQTAVGSFIKKEADVFKKYASFEDVAVLFFDADKDGDQDLFIGAGGNNTEPQTLEIQHRLYLNDGKGNFTIEGAAFANNNMNISVAAANDFDGDGDLDLFVGSRSVPYNYGLTPESYLYVNDGHGHFTDKAAALNPAIATAGMVTGAVWADVVGDKKKELIITGEWMATSIFSYNGKTFDEQKNTNLTNLYGWWQTVAATDVNGDGKQDLVLGNVGENFYLRPDEKNPVKLWVSDFDQNGTPEQFLTRTIAGRDMPVFLKREITEQFPGLRKQNLKHSDYATKSIQDLFGKELMTKVKEKQFNYCKSIVAINDGKGGFTIQSLPVMVQLSSVNAIWSSDINNDGKTDLILGGNMFSFPPQFGRLDGSYGHVLLNTGQGNFTWLAPNESGLSLRGAIRDIKEITVKDKRCMLVVQNDQVPVMFQLKK